MSSAYISKEDLGISVLGTPQYAYAVDGLHHQSYDIAVFRASLRRTSALEDLSEVYVDVIKGRERKIDELGTALASLYKASANFKQGKENPDEANLDVDASAASILRSYGYDASTKMSYDDITILQEDVKYDIDRENNYLQQNTTDLQNYVQKRDDAFSTVSRFMDKVGNTREQGIRNVGS